MKNYDKILIDFVQLLAADDSKVSEADQEALTTYFYNALRTNIQKSFTLVSQPGPGVIRLQVGLIATPHGPTQYTWYWSLQCRICKILFYKFNPEFVAETTTPRLQSMSVIVPTYGFSMQRHRWRQTATPL